MWTTLAPATQLVQLESIAEWEEVLPDEHNEQVPEYSANATDRGGSTAAMEAPQINPAVMRKMYQSLNQTQASVFYTVRDCCTKRVCGQNPDQFFYFVTGGAGVTPLLQSESELSLIAK